MNVPYSNQALSTIIMDLDRRPDTFVNFTLLIILQERTFYLDEQITFLIYLFTKYEHLVRAVRGFRPDCSELSCTGEIFTILDTWEEAWIYVMTNGLAVYMGYSQDLYNVSLLCR